MKKFLLVALSLLSVAALASKYSAADDQPAGEVGAAAPSVAPTPQQLKSVEQAWRRTREAVAKYEQDAAAGALRQGDVQFTRIDMFGVYFGRMVRGGEPPCEACKGAPVFKQMKADFRALDARLSRLERAHFKCDYGYVLPGGRFVPLDVNWSEEEWKKIEGAARPENATQKNHCHRSTNERDWVY